MGSLEFSQALDGKFGILTGSSWESLEFLQALDGKFGILTSSRWEVWNSYIV